MYVYCVFTATRHKMSPPPHTKGLNLDAKRQNHWLFPSRHWLFPSRHWLFLSRHWLFPSRHWLFPSRHWLFLNRHWLFPSRHWLFLSRHWLFPSRHLQWVPSFTSVCCTSFCKRRCIHMYAFIIVVNGIRVRVRVLSATFNTISAI
jgi:hypothetical protein